MPATDLISYPSGFCCPICVSKTELLGHYRGSKPQELALRCPNGHKFVLPKTGLNGEYIVMDWDTQMDVELRKCR
jgi:hypothetical protein